jgi:hypothetical protein
LVQEYLYRLLLLLLDACRLVFERARLPAAEDALKTLCHPDRSQSVSDGAVEGPAVLALRAEQVWKNSTNASSNVEERRFQRRVKALRSVRL